LDHQDRRRQTRITHALQRRADAIFEGRDGPALRSLRVAIDGLQSLDGAVVPQNSEQDRGNDADETEEKRHDRSVPNRQRTISCTSVHVKPSLGLMSRTLV